MAERRRHRDMTDTELERSLTDLGRHLSFPAERDLVPGVRARLDDAPRRSHFWSRFIPASPRQQLAYAFAVIALLLGVTILFYPDTRTAIADRIGLPGVSISGDSTVTHDPSAMFSALQLGRTTSLDDAVLRAGFEVVRPPADVLGEPQAVYLLDRPGGPQVSYVYASTAELPEINGSGVGMVISQFEGHTNESFIQKQLAPGTTVERVTVSGEPGFWLEGEPHLFYYEDPAGTIQQETIRLAANVLLWEREGITLRIESQLSRDDVIHIAESMR